MQNDFVKDKRKNLKFINQSFFSELLDDSDSIEIQPLVYYLSDFKDDYEIKFNDNGEITAITNNIQTIAEERLEFNIADEINESEENNEDLEELEESFKNMMSSNTKRIFSKRIRTDWIPADNYEKIDLPFTPDIFQLQSFYHIFHNKTILVTAHTSSGKTTLVDYAFHISKGRKTKIIYTSPIKALSNQKYYEFKAHKPGIITGDITLDKNSNFLIVTTEILRNMLYNRNNILSNLEYVVFDEVHYLNDPERGVVWEECIIMLPPHVTLILLSATISNAIDLAEWIGRIRNEKIFVISTEKRVVPLEFYICSDDQITPLEKKKKLITKISNNNVIKDASKGKKISLKSKNDNLIIIYKYLIKEKLFPTIFFCFSKSKCQQYANKILKPNVSDTHKQEITKYFKERIYSRLTISERRLPQINEIFGLVLNRVAYHHSGLLPILKELIEILFTKGKIDIIFATETFAMGVNFPAKSVVFVNLSKIDKDCHRFLNSSEFMQMAGRSGRRNVDKKGIVIINKYDSTIKNFEATVKDIMKSPPFIVSKFKLGYNMILQLLRSNIKVEDILRKSYMENTTQKGTSLFLKKLVMVDERIEKLEKEIFCKRNIDSLGACSFCIDLKEYIQKMLVFFELNNKSITRFLEKNSETLNQFLFVDNQMNVHQVVEKFSSFFETRMIIERVTKKDIKQTFESTVYKKYVTMPFQADFTRNQDKSYRLYFANIVALMKNDQIFFDYKLDDLEFITESKQIRIIYESIISLNAYKCPFINPHYSTMLKSVDIQSKKKEIKSKLEDNAFIMYEELMHKIKFLQMNNYIDDDKKIMIKGRVACEIRTVSEIIFTELLFSNLITNLTSREIIAFASSFLLKNHKNEIEEDEFVHKLQNMLEDIFENLHYNEDILKSETKNSFITKIKKDFCFNHINAIIDWYNGDDISKIIAKYKILEGVLLKVILRLQEFCKEIENVCILINDTTILEKIQQAKEQLKREILNNLSLYIDE